MKKLLFLFLLPLTLYSQSTLIFSEYGEGSGFNKWIEIYNPTENNISLSDYRYNFCWNGCDSMQWEYSIAFDSGVVLLPNETYLLVHSNADPVLLNASDQTTNILGNGNDVAGLLNITDNIIVDIIGIVDSVDNITAWDVDGILNATKDHTMFRKPDVCSGNNGDWTLSDGSNGSSEWVVSSIDDYSNINMHVSDCFNANSLSNTGKLGIKLLEIRDLYGNLAIQEDYKILIYIYDNGTVQKKVKIK